ncbi:MAG TPA: ribosome biogenesis GTPase Der [Candidatus Saccharimonadia bacterium]|jgi:GTP-binding protein|nr:ribosome biogenesis GTPase Der [Candidatus Saccharimonadia bacterium]
MSAPIVAIVGRPNVGKSSLFNRLIGQRAAITDDAAGTTRDANYGAVSWSGKHFTLVDTAGLSKAGGEIELQAQDQVKQIAGTAEVIIVVVDAATMITSDDQAAARLALKSGKPVILVLGKIDTAHGTDVDTWRRLGISTIIGVSAIHGRGTGDLLDAVIKHLPTGTAPAEDAPLRLALIGRPNVGKSSLLNALVGKQKAVVSNVPGTTRDTSAEIIRYKGKAIELVDTAGLRRRGKIEPGVEKFSALRTLGAVHGADVCVLVLDASERGVATDLNLAGQILEAGCGLIIVMNKWDAVEEKDENTQARFTAKLKQDFQFAWWAPLVYTSATQGLHVTQLLELAVQIAERRTTQVATGPLNRLIEKLVEKQPPAGLKGRQPKINYATQTGTNPPSFTFFCTYPDLIHFGYRRYLENNIRETWDFTGTPISLEFRHKHGEDLRRGGPAKSRGFKVEKLRKDAQS